MADPIFIQHIFTYVGADDYLFRDALVIEQAEYDALTDAQLDVLKKARYDNWQTRVHTTDANIITDGDEADVPEPDIVEMLE